jgi:hypothetical protein
MDEKNEVRGDGSGHGGSTEQAAPIWILVDQTAREGAYDQVLAHLEQEGVAAQLVTISEVLGTVARDALAGGAERLLRGLRVAVRGRGVDEDFLGAVRRGKPRVLAVTQASHARLLSVVENLAGIDSLHVGILSDYDLAPQWSSSALQAFLVPHDDHRQHLVRSGLPAERILVAGPALRGAVEGELDRQAIRKELGLGDEVVVLVRAEGFDVATLDKLVFQCTLVDRPMRFIFHHNADGATAQALRRAADQYRLRAAMFGRVEDLERYLLAADGVLIAARDSWLPELVALGRPLMIVGRDEQRAYQNDFLMRHGVVRQVSEIVRLGAELDRFADPAGREAMAAASAEIASPQGSKQVAEALKIVLEHCDEWRGPAAPEVQEQDPSKQGAPEEAKHPGPFETIGDVGAAASTASSGSEQRRRAPEPEPERDYAGISQAEAKEQLAQLILLERDLERRQGEVERQQERWRNRLELAREWNEVDLAGEAETVLRGYLSELEAVRRELDDVRLQKDKLRQAARAGVEGRTGSGDSQARPLGPEGERAQNMERRFQKMEVDSDLKGLKDRIRRELGE